MSTRTHCTLVSHHLQVPWQRSEGAENVLCMVIFRRSKEESQDNALKDEYEICQGLPLTGVGPGPRGRLYSVSGSLPTGWESAETAAVEVGAYPPASGLSVFTISGTETIQTRPPRSADMYIYVYIYIYIYIYRGLSKIWSLFGSSIIIRGLIRGLI